MFSLWARGKKATAMYAGIRQASHRSASRYWMTTTVTASQSMSGRDKFDGSKQMSGDFISPLWISRLVQAGRFDQIFTPTSDFGASPKVGSTYLKTESLKSFLSAHLCSVHCAARNVQVTEKCRFGSIS